MVTHSGSLSNYGNTTEFMKSTNKSIIYRGAPFVISAADVPTALNLLKTNSDFTGTDSRTGRGIFQDVNINQAKVNILQAPVRAILLQTPPKIALLDIGGAAIGVLQGYLKDAGLYTSTATAQYPSIGDVFTQFNDVTDFTTSNGLVAGGFSILWAPHWEGNYTITTSQRDAVIQKITAFIDAGHPFLAQCAAVATIEGANSPLSYGDEPASSYGHLVTDATGSTVGLNTNALNQPSFPTGSDAIVVNPSSTVQAYIDPLAQTGDYPLSINVQSWTFDFTPVHGHAYKSYISSYVQSKNAGLQIETVGHKDGDSQQGPHHLHRRPQLRQPGLDLHRQLHHVQPVQHHRPRAPGAQLARLPGSGSAVVRADALGPDRLQRRQDLPRLVRAAELADVGLPAVDRPLPRVPGGRAQRHQRHRLQPGAERLGRLQQRHDPGERRHAHDLHRRRAERQADADGLHHREPDQAEDDGLDA